jgi:hypothetical protein
MISDTNHERNCNSAASYLRGSLTLEHQTEFALLVLPDSFASLHPPLAAPGSLAPISKTLKRKFKKCLQSN